MVQLIYVLVVVREHSEENRFRFIVLESHVAELNSARGVNSYLLLRR